MQHLDFTTAKECAAAFAGATEIGCLVAVGAGQTVASFGHSCDACMVCTAMGHSKLQCAHAQMYSMSEAERFGGKYIYDCPMGLTCFVSPILGDVHSAANITVGPFLMVEKEDYIACELDVLPANCRQDVIDALEAVPLVSPQKVQQLSTLLFMAVGFMNKVSASNRMLALQAEDAMQGQIGSYIMALKEQKTLLAYPIETENALIKSVATIDKENSMRLLNELMGHILFLSGHQFEIVKSRLLELLTLLSRAVIAAGANEAQALAICHQARYTIQMQANTEQLCLELSKATNQLVDMVFRHLDTRHASAIHRCTRYMQQHYYEKITLESLAQMVYLSPTYLSRVFRAETGVLFSTYLNQVRIDKAKALLQHQDLRLTDIAIAIGFEDQSYFTKVFKRVVGLTPLKYRAQLQKNGEQVYW